MLSPRRGEKIASVQQALNCSPANVHLCVKASFVLSRPACLPAPSASDCSGIRISGQVCFPLPWEVCHVRCTRDLHSRKNMPHLNSIDQVVIGGVTYMIHNKTYIWTRAATISLQTNPNENSKLSSRTPKPCWPKGFFNPSTSFGKSLASLAFTAT